MAKKNLKSLSSKKVNIFKIKNRRGYAALCLNHLTEGSTPFQAFERMVKAVKRNGFFLSSKASKK